MFVAAASVVCGALGDPFLPEEVPFESVEREHFDAIGVVHETLSAPPAEASEPPLVLRVHVVGDGANADIGEATEWLLQHANIEVVRDSNGAPLFLTRGDLAATSGRGTLGATVPEGMAVEVGDARVAPCVEAHEMLHFVGLTHVSDDSNIMYPHCSRDFLDRATLNADQRAQVDALTVIRATTPAGVVEWASR